MVEIVLKKITERMIQRFNGNRLPRIDPVFHKAEKRELGLYIHIPFCKSFCSYCPFRKFPYNEKRVVSYIEAVKGEIDLYKGRLEETEIGDIYFGGGTPSLVPEGLVELSRHLKSRFPVKGALGFEANPADISGNDSICRKLRQAGFDRVGIGVQSLSDDVLKRAHCRHNSSHSIRAIKRLMGEGFHLSVDLLFGLPGQTFDDVITGIKKLVELDVPQICAYPVIIPPRSKLNESIKNGMQVPGRKDKKKTYLAIIDYMSQKGYNTGVWQFTRKDVGRDYATCARSDESIGLGVSAFSIMSPYMYINTYLLDDYIKAIAEKRLPIAAGIDLRFKSDSSVKDSRDCDIDEKLSNKHKKDTVEHLAEIKSVMSSIARRGETTKKNFEKFYRITSSHLSFKSTLKLLKILGIVTIKGDLIALSKKGNYYFSVMAENFMPVPGKYGDEVLFSEPFPEEFVFRFIK
ncbi:MAG: radical SAM protein [Spirochaetota bacterium]|nr:radical SAM protein [Spirochaetota bacterium]